MKRKTFHVYRKLSHVTLFIVSLTFTLMLFVEFGDEWYQKLLWGGMGFALEIIKLYLWMHLKSQWKTEKGAAIAQFVIYAGIAFVSMIASLGFAMNTIEGQTFTAQVQNIQVDSMVEDLEVIDSQIATKLRQQSELPFDYITASDRLTEQINDLRLQRKETLERLSAQQETSQGRETESIDTFVLIGRAVGLGGQDTLYYLLLIMVITLEICLVMTSGDIEKRLIVDENPQIISYVNTLFENASSDSRLTTDDAIHEATGIPISECRKYRNFLANISYGSGGVKKPLIESRRGGTKANFTRDGVLKILRFHMNVQNQKES